MLSDGFCKFCCGRECFEGGVSEESCQFSVFCQIRRHGSVSYKTGLGLAEDSTHEEETKDSFELPSIKANDVGQILERDVTIHGHRVCNVELKHDTQRGNVVILSMNHCQQLSYNGNVKKPIYPVREALEIVVWSHGMDKQL